MVSLVMRASSLLVSWLKSTTAAFSSVSGHRTGTNLEVSRTGLRRHWPQLIQPQLMTQLTGWAGREQQKWMGSVNLSSSKVGKGRLGDSGVLISRGSDL